MNEQELQRLLARAERDVEWTPVDPARIRTLAAERRRVRRRRRLVISTVAPLVGLLALLGWMRMRDAGPVVTVADTRPTAERIAELQQRSKVQLEALRETLAEIELELARHDDDLAEVRLDRVREELDVVAAQMMYQADRLRADQRPQEEVLAVYRDVIRLFPETRAASEARDRLNLSAPQGDI